eukprot:221305-Prymnesium_polylepis.1
MMSLGACGSAVSAACMSALCGCMSACVPQALAVCLPRLIMVPWCHADTASTSRTSRRPSLDRTRTP